jgi:hypothetical protein
MPAHASGFDIDLDDRDFIV